MENDSQKYASPDDLKFQQLVLEAKRGDIPVFGVVIKTDQVKLTRAFPSHRPETMEGGHAIGQAMVDAWQKGQHSQPWLYVRGNEYIVSDDYFWLAIVEQGRPKTFSAQILGEPLKAGLVKKVGPLSREFVSRNF